MTPNTQTAGLQQMNVNQAPAPEAMPSPGLSSVPPPAPPISGEQFETGISLVANPHVPEALQVLQQAAQAFQQQGEAAFRNPATIRAMSLAFQPLLEQSVGTELSDDMKVGSVELADMVPTPNGMRLRVRITPMDEDSGQLGEPYEAWLTEGRVPEAAGGKPLELSRQDVAAAIEGLKQVADFQRKHPDMVGKVQGAIMARLPAHHRWAEALIDD